MLQFYFLSILLNIVSGLILVYATNFMVEKNKDALNENLTDEKPQDDSLTTDKNSDEDSSDSFFDKKIQFAVNSKGSFFDDMTFRLVVAVLSGLTGLMKLLSTVQNDVPVIGDLIPAVAGIAACFALLIEFYSTKSETHLVLPSFVSTIFVDGRKYLGIFCIIAGFLHFIFPRVLFL
ncbi:hypothetical protein [Treponema pectinovorum]|uniref:hypothetical protein n=1 Tax=Treponema pectinovorum TaxID=164 RepID=UPI0011C765F1|nr:hypothetical protein [Treponema pectinovorum]